MKEKIALGVDLGGTKIRAGLVTSEGMTIGGHLDVSTEAQRSREIVEGRLFEVIEKSLEQNNLKLPDIVGIGIGSPGPLDLENGTILNAPNLPSLWDYPLRERVQQRYSIPVLVDNDGNCFVLGEAVFSLKNEKSIVAGLTLGTGVGCGIVMDGHVYHGATGTAAEIWKTPFRGKTIDEILSGRGLQSLYEKRTAIEVDAKKISQSADSGDPSASEAWQEYGVCLGEILALLTNLLDPDAIVVGGSLSHAWNHFHETMTATFRLNVNTAPLNHVEILPSQLGDAGGYMGAAALCFSQ